MPKKNKLTLETLEVTSFTTLNPSNTKGGKTTNTYKGCIPKETFLEPKCAIHRTHNQAPWCDPI